MAKKSEKTTNTTPDIQEALKAIRKQFGDDAAMTFTGGLDRDIERVSSGSLGLDLALGGGIPLGRLVEIFGMESSGKSTIALQICAEAQKLGYRVAYMDFENALDTRYMKSLGCDLDNMIISNPNCGEDGFNIAALLMENKYVNVIVFDSVASMLTKAEINGEVGDSFIGTQARMMSQGLKKITPIAAKSNCACIFINQIRNKIGVMFGCLDYYSKVMLADGTTEYIGKIVDDKMQVEVLSYNTKTKSIEPKKIINWFNNGEMTHLYEVTCKKDDDDFAVVKVADDHTFITPTGEKRLSELNADDAVFIRNTTTNELVETKILKIEEKDIDEKKSKYDIQIEDNSNYFVDNILVHNSPETTSGGMSLPFYASVRMRVSRTTAPIKDGEEAIGNETKVKVIKNKVAPPFREAAFKIIYNKGISRVGEILAFGVKYGFLERAGAYYRYNGENVAQGEAKALKWLEENPEIQEDLFFKIKDKALNSDTLDENTVEEDSEASAEELVEKNFDEDSKIDFFADSEE